VITHYHSLTANILLLTGWLQTWKTWNTQGFLWTWKTQEILREFCATSGKNCNKQSIFSSSFKYFCKTAVDWVNKVSWISDMIRVWWWPVILLELMWNDPWWRSLLHLLFVAITYGKASFCLWKSLENWRNLFLLLYGHPVLSVLTKDWNIIQYLMILWSYEIWWLTFFWTTRRVRHINILF